jgi:hypothetical protein
MQDEAETLERPRLFSDLLITAAGIVTTALTVALLVLLELKLEFSLYSYYMLLIVPVGAIAAGFVASSGYYFAAVALGRKPGRLLLLNMLIISAATFFAIHYCQYSLAEVQGMPLRDMLSFEQYLDIIIRSTSFVVQNHGRNAADTGELGVWGYLPALLEVLGFAIGGLSMYFVLQGKPYCDRCSRYLGQREVQTRYATDGEELAVMTSRWSDFGTSGNLPAVLDEHRALAADKPKSKTFYKTEVETRRCSACGRTWLKHSAKVKTRKDWQDVPGLTFTGMADPAEPGAPA